MQLGLLIYDLTLTAPATVTFVFGTPGVGETSLDNPSHPGQTYKAIRFINGEDDVTPRVVLPLPAVNDDAYNIEIDNRSANDLTISNHATLNDTFSLQEFLGFEASLEDEIETRIAAGIANTYRTMVLVTPGGAYRVPGFGQTTPP